MAGIGPGLRIPAHLSSWFCLLKLAANSLTTFWAESVSSGIVPSAKRELSKYFTALTAPDIQFLPGRNLPRQLVFCKHPFSSFDGLLVCVCILLFIDVWPELSHWCGLGKEAVCKLSKVAHPFKWGTRGPTPHRHGVCSCTWHVCVLGAGSALQERVSEAVGKQETCGGSRKSTSLVSSCGERGTRAQGSGVQVTSQD